MEYTSMSERILRSIESIIKNDSDLEDFTLIPTDDNTRNKSPVLYQDHYLGLETWCVKYVYEYVCCRLMKVRRSLAEKKISYSIKEDLNYLITGALLINPDVTTFWNMRRELVEEDVLNYEQELFFSKLVLTRKTKSNEAFAYRRWLINRITAKMFKNGVIPPINILEIELAVCALTANNTPNNYHSWTHRQWCMTKLACYFPGIILRELEICEKWINEHVSENTGYHYRQFLIDEFRNNANMPVLVEYFDKVVVRLKILNDGEECTQFLSYLLGKPAKNKTLENLSKYINYVVLLLYELLVVIESIDSTYTEHESLWLHRRYVIYRLLEISFEFLGENCNAAKKLDNIETFKNESYKSSINIIHIICSDNYGEKQPKIFKSQPSKFESSNMYRILYGSEKGFINRNIVGSVVQYELSKRHEKWLKYIVGFDI